MNDPDESSILKESNEIDNLSTTILLQKDKLTELTDNFNKQNEIIKNLRRDTVYSSVMHSLCEEIKQGKAQYVQDQDIAEYVKDMILQTLFKGEQEVLKQDSKFVEGFNPLFQGMTQFVSLIISFAKNKQDVYNLTNNFNDFSKDITVQLEKKIDVNNQENLFKQQFVKQSKDFKGEFKKMFEEFEDINISKFDKQDDKLDSLMQRMTSVEKTISQFETKQTEKTMINQKLLDISNKFTSDIEKIWKVLDKKSNENQSKLMNEHKNWEQQSQETIDYIKGLMGQFDQKVESVNGVIEKSSQLDELAKRMENFDKLQMEMNAMIVKNDELKTSMLTSLQKCNDKLDKNTELLHEARNNEDFNINDINDIARKGSRKSEINLGSLTNEDIQGLKDSLVLDIENLISRDEFERRIGPLEQKLENSTTEKEEIKNELIEQVDEKLLDVPTQDALGEQIQDIKSDINRHNITNEEAEKQRMKDASHSSNYSAILIKHQEAISNIERTLKKMIQVEDDMCLKAQQIYCLSCGNGYGPKGKDMSPVKTRDRSKSRDFKEFNLTDKGLNPNFRGSVDANSFSTSHQMEQNHLDTSRTHAEGVENSFRELKKVIQNTDVKQEIEKGKSRVDIRINNSIDADKETNDLAENLSVQNERLTKNRYSPNVLTKKISKLVDVSNSRLTRQRQDLIDRTHNVEGNLVSFKQGKSGKKE